jgi:hypothetical protein
MDEWSHDDEIDWLTSAYTYKKNKLRRVLENLEGRAEF